MKRSAPGATARYIQWAPDMPPGDNFLFGIHSILEAIHSGRELDKVLIRRGAGSDLMKELIAALHKHHIPFQQVPVEKLNSITRKNHQGAIAWLSVISYGDITSLLPAVFESGRDPLVLILDGVSDVRNFGAIARSAECAGVDALVIPAAGSARINADAIKTSAGALHRIPVCRQSDLVRVTRFLKDSGLSLYAATERAEEDLFRTDLTGPAGIILGSEEQGISPALLKEAGQWISIPMKGNISSLNVSVAAGIILYEVLRQRAQQ